MTSGRSAVFLVGGDAVCVAVFVLAGLQTHSAFEGTGAGLRFLFDFVPLLLAWGVAALACGALRFDRPVRLRAVWGRTLLAWLLAAPYGLVLRALLTGRSSLIIVFMAVTAGLGGLLLLAWRTLFAWLAWIRQPAGAAPAAGR